MKKMMMLAVCLMAIVGVVSCGQMPISNSTYNADLSGTTWTRDFQTQKAPLVKTVVSTYKTDGTIDFITENESFLSQSSEVITFGKLDNKTNVGAYSKETVLDAVAGGKTLEFPVKENIEYEFTNKFLGKDGGILTEVEVAQKIVLPKADLFTEKVIETGTWTIEKTALNETVYKIVVTKTETLSQEEVKKAWSFDEPTGTHTVDAAKIKSKKVFNNSTSEEKLFPGTESRANVGSNAVAYYVKKAENGKELVLTDESGVKTFAIVSK